MKYDERLKSCPLCGGKGYIKEDIKVDKIRILTVACEKCNCSTSMSFFTVIDNPEQRIINKWNTRVNEVGCSIVDGVSCAINGAVSMNNEESSVEDQLTE